MAVISFVYDSAIWVGLSGDSLAPSGLGCLQPLGQEGLGAGWVPPSVFVEPQGLPAWSLQLSSTQGGQIPYRAMGVQ